MKESTLSPRQWAFVVVAGGAACALPFVQSTKTTDQNPIDYKTAGDFATQSTAEPITLADIAPAEPEQRLPDWAAHRSPFDDLTTPTLSKSSDELTIAPLEPLRPWISGPTEPAATLPAASPPKAAVVHSVTTTPPSSVFKSDLAINDSASEARWKEQTPFAVSSEETLQRVDRWPDQRSVAADSVLPPHSDPHRDLVSALVEPKTPSPMTASMTAPIGPTRPATLSRNPMAQSIAAQRTFGQPGPMVPTLETPPNQPLPTLPAERKERIIFQPSLRKQH